jgi:nicotinate-nucleotide pyrophosphorylase (carboxylating)
MARLFALPDVRAIVASALAEDLGVPVERFAAAAAGSSDLLARDVTSSSAISRDARFAGRIVARQECVVAGLQVAHAVFDTLSLAAGLFEPIEVFPLVAEGARVKPGTPVLEIEGVATAVLTGERTALDFLMLLSGIATETARWVEAAGPDLDICDTRKTAPGLRELSKYGVAVGGGVNHRMGLYDMVLIKDNHIRAAGGIRAAVESAKLAAPDLLVEVEADTLAQAKEAVESGADLVLLDNMSDDLLGEAVLAVRQSADELGRTVLTEASGGIRRDRLAALRAAGVDRVSTSALTMGVAVVDFGLDEA